jgi:hypothetical protein
LQRATPIFFIQSITAKGHGEVWLKQRSPIHFAANPIRARPKMFNKKLVRLFFVSRYLAAFSQRGADCDESGL